MSTVDDFLDGRTTRINLPSGKDSLDFLQAVYRDSNQPLPVRMRAASIAIKYERPALAVTVQTSMSEFNDRLERAWMASHAARVAAGSQQIEGPGIGRLSPPPAEPQACLEAEPPKPMR